jgi:hypothetical protein
MSVTLDILASWRRPRAVMRGIMGQGKSEPFAFSLLVTGLILLYLSLTPFLAREAYFHPEQPLTQRLVAAALSMGATVPIWCWRRLAIWWRGCWGRKAAFMPDGSRCSGHCVRPRLSCCWRDWCAECWAWDQRQLGQGPWQAWRLWCSG